MIKRDELINTINGIIGQELLAKANLLDHRANGVQIVGKAEASKLCLGVTCNMDFLREAVDSGADFCLFHHGVDLDRSSVYNSRLNLSQQQELKYIFAHDLTIAGYHLSLDAQPELGNASTIIRLLGAKRLNQQYMSEWGWVGEFAKPQAVEELAEKLSDILDHDIFAVYGGPKKVTRLGVATGGAKPVGEYLHEIVEQGIDLHVTGEIGEPGPYLAKEVGFNYFAGGHYATEVFGVQELGKKIKEVYKDKLEVEFIDIPNPL